MVYVVRWLGPRVSKTGLLVVALIAAMLGMAWLSRVDTTSSYLPDVLLPLLVLGVGQGMAIILLTEFGMADVEPTDAGAASGLVNTAHQLGGSIGLALLTVVFGGAIHHDPSPSAALAAHGYAHVFTVTTFFYVAAVLIAIAIHLAQRRAAHRTRLAVVRAA
jgi:sugar phosphate permease